MTRPMIILMACVELHAATIPAASTSRADVQSAINSASDGDIVTVPTGSSTWTTAVSISNKKLWLQGNGTNNTVITDGVTGTGPFFTIASGSKFVVVTGFHFICDIGPKPSGTITISGTAYRFATNRISAIEDGTAAIQVNDAAAGLVDHCIFQNASGGNATGIQWLATTNSWNSAVSYGITNEWNYVEDTTFNFSLSGGVFFANGAVDAFNGAKYAFRFNICTNANIGHHGCDSGGYRSTYACEVYGNRIHVTATVDTMLQSRGGTGMYYSNHVSGANNHVLKLQNFRIGGSGSTCATQLGDCPPWGSADGSNVIDGNDNASGWPTLDQIGRTGPTTFGGSDSTQGSSPARFFANTIDNASGFSTVGTDDEVDENRDWFATAPGTLNQLAYPHPLIAATAVEFGAASTVGSITATGITATGIKLQ